jgi:hypothetical protein
MTTSDRRSAIRYLFAPIRHFFRADPILVSRDPNGHGSSGAAIPDLPATVDPRGTGGHLSAPRTLQDALG